MHAVAFGVKGVGDLSSWGFVSAVSMNGAKIVSKDSRSIYKSLQEAVIYFSSVFSDLCL